jgi:hypothetical protein
MTKLEPIVINPLEELLKAYRIVHGSAAGNAVEYVVWRILQKATEERRMVEGDGI